MRVLVVGLLTLASGLGQPQPVRQPNESLADFAARLTPSGMRLAHPPVEGEFGPGSRNIVLLFQPAESADSNFRVSVLIPETDGRYRSLEAPPLDLIAGHFDVTVNAVMFAATQPGPQRDLLVLYAYHRTGSEQDDGNAVAAYSWNGKAFLRDEAAERRLLGAKTAADVRKRLKASQTNSQPKR